MLDFPITSTIVRPNSQAFDLTNPVGRKAYFKFKVDKEINFIKKKLEKRNFIAFLSGKKNSGKGTYAKLLAESLASSKIVHLSVGDLVRSTNANWKEISQSKKQTQLKELYRGPISFDEAVKRLTLRDTTSLLPTEFVLALIRLEFINLEGKSVFIDGFPRDTDQIPLSLFFKEIVGRKDDQDLFILIDVPSSVINERIKYRVICPICHTPRNTKLLVTSQVGFDKGEFYLMCDDLRCKMARMVGKEGDNLGIAPIKDRLAKDQLILEKLYGLSGINKIFLRNSVPLKRASQIVDSYELTPSYSFQLNNKEVKVNESPWVVKDDNGIPSYSLLPPPVVVSLIKQLAEALRF